MFSSQRSSSLSGVSQGLVPEKGLETLTLKRTWLANNTAVATTEYSWVLNYKTVPELGLAQYFRLSLKSTLD